jgi:hypothetical protein
MVFIILPMPEKWHFADVVTLIMAFCRVCDRALKTRGCILMQCPGY